MGLWLKVHLIIKVASTEHKVLKTKVLKTEVSPRRDQSNIKFSKEFRELGAPFLTVF